MQLNNLPKSTNTKQKRLGRGYGSGKGGHTASRGQKGQKTRRSIPTWFEGGQLPFIRRLPFIKGKNRFKSLHKDTVVLNLSDLEKLKEGQTINLDLLIKQNLVSKNQINQPIKILGRGKLTKAFTVKLPVSKQAQEKIQKAGGKIEKDLKSLSQ